jgi:hypothetical protein
MSRKFVLGVLPRLVLFRLVILALAVWTAVSYGSGAIWIPMVLVLLFGLEGILNLGRWRSADPPAKYREIGRYRVVLQVPGPKAIHVIKALRETRGLSLLEAKEMVDSPPVVVAEGLSEQSAELVADRLRAAGARALAAPIGEM